MAGLNRRGVASPRTQIDDDVRVGRTPFRWPDVITARGKRTTSYSYSVPGERLPYDASMDENERLDEIAGLLREILSELRDMKHWLPRLFPEVGTRAETRLADELSRTNLLLDEIARKLGASEGN
jgi:hypothetical protein